MEDRLWHPRLHPKLRRDRAAEQEPDFKLSPHHICSAGNRRALFQMSILLMSSTDFGGAVLSAQNRQNHKSYNQRRRRDRPHQAFRQSTFLRSLDSIPDTAQGQGLKNLAIDLDAPL